MPILGRIHLNLLLVTSAALLCGTLLIVKLAGAHPLPAAPICPIFPADNPWNQRVDQSPVAHDSATLIRSIGLMAPVLPGFAAGLWEGHPIGIPINVVPGDTRRVGVTFDPAYVARADRARYALPANAAIEAGPDHHLIAVDPHSCLDYELYGARLLGGRWLATNGIIFNLRSDRLRRPGWPSADAAGLPILPGLARYDEVRRGSIDHALRFYAPNTRAAWVYPARHDGGGTPDPALPPMGLRVRLKANVDISRLPQQARVVALALKRYGMILADNGPAWTISGTSDARWNNVALHQLDQLSGRDFEVVDTSSLPHPR